MNKTMKWFAIGIVWSFTLLLISCKDEIDIPARTPETEKIEINKAVRSLVSSGFEVDSTETGLYFILHKEGTGPFPEKSDTCQLIYNAFFLSGDIFDSSGLYYNDSIWQFRYLEVPLIPGFNQGVALLNKGAQADIIVPSKLAYSAMGYGSIPPYTPLFFNLKMVNVKPVVKE
jgi:FKBP-type peptidyl-prolyl cis-trans isomerase FkpA